MLSFSFDRSEKYDFVFPVTRYISRARIMRFSSFMFIFSAERGSIFKSSS